MKNIICILLCLSLMALEPAPAWGADPLKVVATLSSYADIAKSVGGNHVECSYVASPKYDPHFIEPKPSDVLRLKRADLFIHSGLDLEAWRQPLVDAAARSEIRSGGEQQLDLSKRIALLNIPASTVSRAEGDIHLFGNPHYWVDPRNGLIIAEDIAGKLSQIDPVNAGDYQANLKVFNSRLSAEISRWSAALAPYKGTGLAAYHDSWPYLINFAGLKIDLFLEPKPGIPPTPKQVEAVISRIRSEKIPAIIVEPYFSHEAAEQIAGATNVKIITLVQNVGAVEQASDYIAMVNYNVQELIKALQK